MQLFNFIMGLEPKCSFIAILASISFGVFFYFKFLFLFYLPNSLFLLGNACPSIPGSEFPHQVSGIPMRSYFILGARQQVRLLYCSVPRQWHTDTCITSVVFLASSPIILTCILLHNMPPAMFFSFSYPL